MTMLELLEESPIIAAVKSQEGLEHSLKSEGRIRTVWDDLRHRCDRGEDQSCRKDRDRPCRYDPRTQHKKGGG